MIGGSNMKGPQERGRRRALQVKTQVSTTDPLRGQDTKGIRETRQIRGIPMVKGSMDNRGLKDTTRDETREEVGVAGRHCVMGEVRDGNEQGACRKDSKARGIIHEGVYTVMAIIRGVTVISGPTRWAIRSTNAWQGSIEMGG